MTLREAIAKAVFAVGIETVSRAIFRQMMAAAETPREAQQRALRSILLALQETGLGRSFGYHRIRSPDEFRRGRSHS